MSLFLSLLPIYIFGNLHCASMCGPLVALLSKNQYRWFYFLGRLISFSFAGMVSAEMGLILTQSLAKYHIPSLFCLSLGAAILLMGVFTLFRLRFPVGKWLGARLGRLNFYLSQFILKEHPLFTFLFGFFTVILPCGQTLVVFSACALSASPLVGLLNGALFALLTSPSLVAAMHSSSLLKRSREHYPFLMGCTTILIGLIACLRGVADIGWISHYTLNPNSSLPFHIVLF